MKALRLLMLAGVLTLGAGAALADPQPTTIPPSRIQPEAVEWDVEALEPLLPHWETQAEREFWRGREDQMPGQDLRDDPPPLAPVRNCAEWEPATGVMIRYPLGLPYNLLRDFDDDVILHVVVSSSQQASAQTALTNNGIDMARVEFLVRPTIRSGPAITAPGSCSTATASWRSSTTSTTGRRAPTTT